MKLPIWGEHANRQLKLDCHHYRGDRPCAQGIQDVCPTACDHYAPFGHRILIIKLGALGDVIRTAAILPGLKEVYPQSQITWVSRPNGVRALSNHPLIDRLLPFDAETTTHLEYERFDLCLNLDKEPGPAALAMRVDATERRGIGLSTFGTPYPLNESCADYFRLGLSDELKFHHNEKSYPELVYGALDLPYRGQRYHLYPTDAQKHRAAQLWQQWHVKPDDVVVGLNTGAGKVFANKNWPPERFVELGRRLIHEAGWRVALLGGPDEHVLNQQIARACPGAIETGCNHSELEFAALISRCQTVVTGDTMGMHVAIACEIPCVVLFGPTCHQEIDLHDCGEQIRTSLSCAPCYRRHCDFTPNCMDVIPVDRVYEAVRDWVGTARSTGRPARTALEVRT